MLMRFSFLLLFAFALGGCNSNNGSNNNFASCGNAGAGLPACPDGAHCGGPCDPDASVTTCAGGGGCTATCGPVGAIIEAGVFVADANVEWRCTIP
jgi:hypothetical protein